MINPYAPTDITIEAPPISGRSEASLIWFAVPLTVLLFVREGYYAQGLLSQIGAISAAFECVRDMSVFVVCAVIVFAAARYVVRMQFDYASTKLSLFIIGIVATGYVALLQYLDWRNIYRDHILWTVGSFVGLLLGVGLSLLERSRVGVNWMRREQSEPATNHSIRNQPNHASIMWFSGAVCLSISAFVAYTTGGRQLDDLVEVASTMCVVFTSAYGFISVCFVRRHAATVMSRFSAAAVYTGVLILITVVVPSPGANELIIPVALLGPAIFAVAADRLIARYSAGV